MDAGVHVLHVDDDPASADLTAEMLERADDRISVTTATSAEAGLDRVRDETPDCIVSDYDMPGTDGIEFLKAVRDDHPDLPFVLFTGKGSEAVAGDAISAGATDYLQKGTGTEQYDLLANRVLNAVEQHRASRAAERTQRRLREIADTSVDCLWMFSREWDDLLFVSGYEEVWGRSPESLREDPSDFLETVHPDDRPSVEAAMERLSAGERAAVEYRIRVDGETKWVWVKGQPIFDDAGEVARIVGFARDTTERKRREQALHRERDSVEQALDALKNVFYVVGVDGRIRRWNDRLERVTGYDAADLDGMPAIDLFPEADRPVVSDALSATIDGDRDDLAVKASLRTADGDRLPYEFTGARLTDPDGDLVGVVGIGRDLSERREQQRQLAETTRKLEALTEAFPDLAFIMSEDGRYLEAFAGPETESLLYGGPEAYQDGERHLHDVFDDARADRVRETIRDAIDTGGIQSIEYELTVNDEPRWFEGRVAPVDARVDGHRAAILVVRDITDRKEQERQFQALLDNTGSSVYLKNADGVYERVNKAASENVDTSLPALEGAHVSEVFDGDADAAASLATDRYVMESGERVVEEAVRTIDGEERTFLSEKFPYRNAEGDVVGVMGISRDITDRKERERELQRQNDRLEEFAGIVSHDLRNPLQVAAGHLQLAAEDHDGDHVRAARAAIDRSQELVEDLLTLARNDSEEIDLSPVDLPAAVDAAWQRVDADAARLAVDTDRCVRADRTRLVQLLENLLRNAAEHGGGTQKSRGHAADRAEQAAVTITVGDLDDEPGFYVADDGPGIPEAERERVFEAGYSTAESGTGLGLRIVERSADAHGWTVRVVDAPAGGARFEITGVEPAESPPDE